MEQINTYEQSQQDTLNGSDECRQNEKHSLTLDLLHVMFHHLVAVPPSAGRAAVQQKHSQTFTGIASGERRIDGDAALSLSLSLSLSLTHTHTETHTLDKSQHNHTHTCN